MWNFPLNAACKSYNSLEMDEDGKTPDKKFLGLEFQICPTGYHTWGFPIVVLYDPLQGWLTGIPKWEPITRTSLYLVHSPFHAGPLDLILNIRTRDISPQYHVVFDKTLSTVEHMRKGILPVNCKNFLEYHSEITMQENSLSQNIDILDNTKSFPCLERPDNRTHRSRVPKTYLQGPIPMLQLAS